MKQSEPGSESGNVARKNVPLTDTQWKASLEHGGKYLHL